jgi:hypothetical protein
MIDIPKVEFPPKTVSSTNTKKSYIKKMLKDEVEGWNFLDEEVL